VTIHTDAGFSTGTYVVTRFLVGTWVDGRYVDGATTTVLIDAAEYPAEETQTEQTQGTESVEQRTLFTDSPLFGARESPAISGQPGVGLKADLVEIEGHQWIVRKVSHYKALSGHYTATVEKLNPGEAT